MAEEWSARTETPANETATSKSGHQRLVEVVAVVLLSLGSLLTAWSGYEAALWGGDQSIKFGDAAARRVDSARASARADQLTAIDVTIFGNYLNAYATGQQNLAAFYQERFRDEFKPAFDAWIATSPRTNLDAPSSPFGMPEYRLTDRDKADQLETEARVLFDEGMEANQHTDEYVLTAVVLASVLFLAGISSRVHWQPARSGVVTVAIVIFCYGVYQLATMPIH